MKREINCGGIPTRIRQHMSGFALVATLTLMILLTMVAVGLLSLSAISLRNSSQGMAQGDAQANARLALMIAIGELQKQMGPDQRISVTADQRIAAGSDGDATSAAAGNRHWTGVSNAWPGAAAQRPAPVFRSWLVSGEKTTSADVEVPLLPLGSIELVGAGTVGSGDGRVNAPATVISSSGGSSRMAWLIGDQGVKASVATQRASIETTLGALRGTLQGAPPNALELASTGSLNPFSALDENDPRIRLVTSWQQSGFLASDPVAPKSLFHDLAASSTGLMTNVRAGGIRKDLSMKLESHTSPPDLSRINGQPSPNVLYYVQNEEGINNPCS